jgi:DNA polymerase-3 subunit gamma/tau
VSDIMVLLNEVINKGFDGGLLIQGLAKHVRNVLMAKDPQTLPLLEVSEQARQRYQEQAQRADTRFLYGALRLMNQCDINYRQSSNKRLLVELTLIEVAQLTQPDEGPASGRRPRRLKSLFKQLIRQSQPQTAAPQVAAAATANQTKETTRRSSDGVSPVAPSATESPKPAAAPQPKVKLGALGMSWNNLRNMSKAPKMNILPGTMGAERQTGDERIQFTQEDLELQWMSMCNRMPQTLVGIATRMKNMTPVITDLPKVEVVVGNELIQAEMEKIRGSIQNTLRMYLHNSGIELTIRVDEHREEVKLLTRGEQFEELTKSNPAVEKLREAFSLVLA